MLGRVVVLVFVFGVESMFVFVSVVGSSGGVVGASLLNLVFVFNVLFGF